MIRSTITIIPSMYDAIDTYLSLPATMIRGRYMQRFECTASSSFVRPTVARLNIKSERTLKHTVLYYLSVSVLDLYVGVVRTVSIITILRREVTGRRPLEGKGIGCLSGFLMLAAQGSSSFKSSYSSRFR